MKLKGNKSGYFLVIIALVTALMLSNAKYPGDDIINEIAESINKMDSKKLSGYFGSSIDLEFNNSSANYSKAQAEIILRDFFKENTLQSFTVNHQGESKDGSRYFIGTYKSAVKKFRVYGLLKKEESGLHLQQLQFEEE